MVRVMGLDECEGDDCPGDTTKKVRRDDTPSDQRKMSGVICPNPIHYKKPMNVGTFKKQKGSDS